MALPVGSQLVEFVSVNLFPEEDPFIQWLYDLGFWDIEVKFLVKASKGSLPPKLEARFKEMFELPFDYDCQRLFSKLISSPTGIPLSSLGFCDGGYEDPETCVGKMLSLKIARVQDNTRFKPLKIAFDPRVQYLIGVRPVPSA